MERLFIDGSLVDESVPVAVPHGNSDIDLVAMRPDGHPIQLPDGASIGPRLLVETKDEHDYDPTGRYFGKGLAADVGLMGELPYVAKGIKGIKFTMLQQEHYEAAIGIFGTVEFDRLFVVHALDPAVRGTLAPALASEHRIFLLTMTELIADLVPWYEAHPRPAGLRHTFVGDLLHLLIGYCQLKLPSSPAK
jgi:hypothetical protein